MKVTTVITQAEIKLENLSEVQIMKLALDHVIATMPNLSPEVAQFYIELRNKLMGV
jgi:hypothetical protein